LLSKIGRWPMEKGARSRSELSDLPATIAFEPEGGRSTSRVVTALELRLDDQRLAPCRDFRAEARPGDPATYDYDVEVHMAGYEFESPAV
jgi:hypothetical protein